MKQNLRCPRCDSSNTKFCYYGDFGHHHPWHFCKACRRKWINVTGLRYWTNVTGLRYASKYAAKPISRVGSNSDTSAGRANLKTLSFPDLAKSLGLLDGTGSFDHLGHHPEPTTRGYDNYRLKRLGKRTQPFQVGDLSVVPPTPTQKIYSLFNKFDAKGDGKISAPELTVVLESKGCKTSLEWVQSAMTMFKKDGNGSLKEFKDLYCKTFDIEKNEVPGSYSDINQDHTAPYPSCTEMSAIIRQSSRGEVYIDMEPACPNININDPNLQEHPPTIDLKRFEKLAALFLTISSAAGIVTPFKLAKFANGIGFVLCCAAIVSIQRCGSGRARASTTRILTKLGATACVAGTVLAIVQELAKDYTWAALAAALLPSAVMVFL